MNVFEAVKQSVTTRQAAEHYGIRVGRNGMACCPFHHDKTEVQADLKKLRDIRYWVRKATPGTEESKEPPKKQPLKEVLQDKADEKKAQRTAPVQTKHKQQDMEL